MITRRARPPLHGQDRGAPRGRPPRVGSRRRRLRGASRSAGGSRGDRGAAGVADAPPRRRPGPHIRYGRCSPDLGQAAVAAWAVFREAVREDGVSASSLSRSTATWVRISPTSDSRRCARADRRHGPGDCRSRAVMIPARQCCGCRRARAQGRGPHGPRSRALIAEAQPVADLAAPRRTPAGGRGSPRGHGRARSRPRAAARRGTFRPGRSG